MRNLDDAARDLAAVEHEGREHAFMRFPALEHDIGFDTFEGRAVAGGAGQIDDHLRNLCCSRRRLR
jgi:hypothetical protein